MTIKNDYLARLLKLRPCPEMSTYDFLYRIASDLVYTSNSFSVIFYNEDFTRITSIQPITTKSYRIFEDDCHNILFRFRWDYDGETYTVPYQNVIHIKARYNKKRFLGTSPDLELKRSLDLIETSGETVKNMKQSEKTSSRSDASILIRKDCFSSQTTVRWRMSFWHRKNTWIRSILHA